MIRTLLICCFVTISTLFAGESLKEIFQEKENIQKQKKIFCDNERAKIDNIIQFLESEFDFYAYSKEKLEEKWNQKAELVEKLKQMTLSLDIENPIGEECRPYGSFIGDDFMLVAINNGGCMNEEGKIRVMAEYGQKSCIGYPNEQEITNIIKDAYVGAPSKVDMQKAQQNKHTQGKNDGKDNKNRSKCLNSCKLKKGAAYDICINDCKRIYGGAK
ncbi:MAG: hypothetical protein PHE67_07320 [Campylobacterales bacterium]|nr:hypothetical protein [Campylobacterales bacterium]